MIRSLRPVFEVHEAVIAETVSLTSRVAVEEAPPSLPAYEPLTVAPLSLDPPYNRGLEPVIPPR
jgi:hypothetical protein